MVKARHLFPRKPVKNAATASAVEYATVQQDTNEEPRLNSASQRTLQYGLAARNRSVWSRGWMWESLSAFVAVATFGGIIALLNVVDDAPIPDWPSGISVNAVLSVLVTVLKGAMCIIIAESLSQYKWAWFQRHRKLLDLYILEEASRGVVGSLRLMFTLRTWLVAYLGAFVFISAFIVGPTVQQTVETRVRLVEETQNATMPICNSSYYDVVGFGAGAGMNKAELPTIGAMYNGLLQTTMQAPIKAFCPSGNCTFPPYHTLGICNKCRDISHEILYWQTMRGTLGPTSTLESEPSNTDEAASSESTDTIEERNNALLRRMTPDECARNTTWCYANIPEYGLELNSLGLINSTTFGIAYVNETFGNLSDIVSVRTLLRSGSNYSTDGESGLAKVSAVECTLRFCVKTYNATVDAGTLTETLLESSSKDTSVDGNYTEVFRLNVSIPVRPCYINGVEVNNPADHPQCQFRVQGKNLMAIFRTLSPMLEGYGDSTNSYRPYWSSDVMPALWGFFDSMDFYDTKRGTIETVERAMSSLADVVTAATRSNTVCGGAFAQGTQYRTELYLRVNWAWIVPSALILVFTLIFFLMTVLLTLGKELWKSSPFAYLANRPIVQMMSDGMMREFDFTGHTGELREKMMVRFETEVRQSGMPAQNDQVGH